MVYFSCNSCGSSIKKNQVEKHRNIVCKNCRVLSCLDCGKDFIGEAYKKHTQCITEAEKYSAKGSQLKSSQAATENKQQAWVTVVRVVAQESKSANPRVQELLQFLSEQESTPRKKPKFENFLRSAYKNPPQEIIDEIWNLLSRAQEKLKNSKEDRSIKETVSDAGDTAGQEGEKLNKKERKAERKRKQMKVEKKDAKIEKNDEEEERGKKKRKHKLKHDAADDSVSVEQKEEEVVTGKKKRKHEGEEDSKRKKKRKHYEETEDVTMNGEEGQAEEEHNAGAYNDKENESRRKKKRKYCDEDNNNEGGEGQKEHEESKKESSKKKKKQQNGEEDMADVKQETHPCMQEYNSGDVGVGVGSAKKFKWENVIKAILQSKDGEVSLKRLQKKVIAEYHARGGDGKGKKSMESLCALFNKKVKKNPKFKVLKDRVKLVE